MLSKAKPAALAVRARRRLISLGGLLSILSVRTRRFGSRAESSCGVPARQLRQIQVPPLSGDRDRARPGTAATLMGKRQRRLPTAVVGLEVVAGVLQPGDLGLACWQLTGSNQPAEGLGNHPFRPPGRTRVFAVGTSRLRGPLRETGGKVGHAARSHLRTDLGPEVAVPLASVVVLARHPDARRREIMHIKKGTAHDGAYRYA